MSQKFNNFLLPFRIDLNKKNYISYYLQGTQYATEDVTGSQIMCESNNFMFENNQLVTNIIIVHEDVILIEDATLFMDENKIGRENMVTLIEY